ncbi:MAG: extracellular solute-binding protein [Thaumarchaeota archaeon]|nr:extracellular solute-binding protein [Nitrososphaerota archaeon]
MRKILEDASKERQLVIYAALPGVLGSLISAFRGKYKEQNFHVTYLSGHPVPIAEKIRAEIKTGIPSADVIILPQYSLMQLENDGLLQKYDSPELSTYPSNYYEHGGAALTLEPTGLMYSTVLVRENELPKTLDDLTDKRWKGMIAMQSLTRRVEGLLGIFFLASLRRTGNEKQWTTFLKKLASDIRPKTYDCLHHMKDATKNGKHAISFPGALRAESLKEVGGIEPFFLHDVPPTAILRSIGILKNSTHSNVAKLFVDFALSKDWQSKLGETKEGMVPARLGIQSSYWISSPLSKGVTIFPNMEEVQQVEEFVAAYRQAGLD